jgi:hypothetical protein
MPATMRNASGSIVTPIRRTSSDETIAAAAGACSSLVSFLKREVSEMTSTSTSCSMLMSASWADFAFDLPPSTVAAFEFPKHKNNARPIPKINRNPWRQLLRNESPNAAPVSLSVLFISAETLLNCRRFAPKAMHRPFLGRFRMTKY